MTATDRPMRADALRNREAILEAAGELFARRGQVVQMDEIAERAGLGMGTLYRHFATKQALLAAIIGRRFEAMAELAREAEQVEDPGEAFVQLARTYLEAAERDAAFQYGLMGPERPDWDAIKPQKAEFAEVAERVVARAVAAGRIRADFVFDDFILITRGAMANMRFGEDWRRHLELTLEGVRA